MNRHTIAFSFVLSWACTLAVAQDPTARLEGQTLDTLGMPLGNCLVAVESAGLTVSTTRSDGTGYFVVPRVPQATIVVRAMADDAVGAVRMDLAGEGSGFTRVSTFPARTLRGVVRTSSGQPAPGAWITVTPKDLPELQVIDAMTQCDESGRFELPMVLAVAVEVVAWKEGRQATVQTVHGHEDAAIECTVGDAPEQELRFVLADASPQQLRDANFTAARQRRVRPQGTSRIPGKAFLRLPPPLARSKPDAEGVCMIAGWLDEELVGHFELGTAPTDATILPPHQVTVTATRRDEVTFWTIADSASHVRGKLVDAIGAPLKDTVLMIRPLANDYACFATAYGRTREDGTFALPAPVREGDHFALRVVDPTLAISDDDSRAAGSRSWLVGQHDPQVRHEARAISTPAMLLRVVSGDGTPVRGVATRVYEARPRNPNLLAIGASDMQGRVELFSVDRTDIESVRIVLQSPEGHLQVDRDLDPEALELGEFTLDPPATIVGTVTRSDGSRAIAAPVWVNQRLTLTDREGRFALRGVLPGRCRCHCTPGTAATVDLVAGQTISVELVAN